MSKINDLISALCPAGVPFKRMGDIGSFYGGLSGKSKDDFKDGNAVFITYMNVYSNIELKTDVEDRVRVGENEKQNTVQYGDILFTGSSETPDECGMSSVLSTHTDKKLYLNSFCFGYRFSDPDMFLPGFSKHLFRSNDLRHQITKTASGVTRFNVSKKKMEDVTIPVPPIEVQREIVRVLDNFTELTEELTEELIARKQQYEYYREKLLKADNDEARSIRLSDLFKTRNGYTPSKSNDRFWKGDTCIPWFRMEDIRERGRILTDSMQHVTKEAVKGDLFPEDSIIISTSATIGEHALIKVPSLANQRFTYLMIKPEYKKQVNIKYLFYYCFLLDVYCKEHLNQGNFASVDMTKFGEFEFVIPPLDRQDAIVEILEHFDRICNDITEGLPAEIEARQKQYSYYRDKLLTFYEI